MSGENCTRMISLKSEDGHPFCMEIRDCFHSLYLKGLIEDLNLLHIDQTEPVKVPVDLWTLKKIQEYSEKHRGQYFVPKPDDMDQSIVLTASDEAYMDVEPDNLMKLLLAANTLEIGGIVEMITQKIADASKNKSVEEIRELFNLVNDFTPEEEEEIRQRFEWMEAP